MRPLVESKKLKAFKLRILLTVHQFFPEYSSGTEVLTFSVAKELLQCGHEVFVFTGHPAKQQLPDRKRFDKYVIGGIEVYRFHHAFVPMGEQNTLSELEYDNHLVASFFAHLIDTIHPDVVHFFHFSRLGASLVDVARQKAIPAYYTPTDFWAICPTSQLLLSNGSVCHGPAGHGGNCIKHVASLTRWNKCGALAKYLPDFAVDCIAVAFKSGIRAQVPFRRDIAALSQRLPFIVSRINALHGIVSPTHLMTKMLTRNGVDERLIVQSAFGLDISGFDEVQRDFSSRQQLIVGYIGTLAPHKGCHVLIEAFLQLKTNGSRLRIYGNLSDFPNYVERLKKISAGREEIEFLGTFPNDQVASVMAGIDLLVVPSVWYENTPLVVYSALAAKCPVIASNYPGMSEVVRDGWNGLTFEAGNSAALTKCLLRIFQTPELLKKLSANCQMPKSISTYVHELLELYNDRTRIPLNAEPQRQVVASFDPSQQCGHISGWMLIGREGPKVIRLLSEGKEVASATRFYPRPDVLEAFNESGKSVNDLNCGFVITISGYISVSKTVMVIEDCYGNIYEIPFKNLKIGEAVDVANNVVVGIDEVKLEHKNS
jgi:glycosyltransferase involved in cell wall biosynthesis